MKVPIVTTEFGFNKDVCGKYASYFKAGEWEEAAKEIKYLLYNKSAQKSILMPSDKFDEKFKSFRENYEETISFLNEIYQRENKKSLKVY